MYEYRARIVSVYDGDTVRCDIDLGFGMWMNNQPLRLFGIDAPEVRGKERLAGIKVRDWLRRKLPEGRMVLVQTRKDTKGKYGRYLATIYADGDNLNELMLKQGYVDVYE